MRISDWSSDVCSSDLRIHLRRGTRRVARDEAPQHGLVVGVANGGEVEQHGEAERRPLRGRRAVMAVPDRILPPRRCIFLLKLAEKKEVVVDGFRDSVEIAPLTRLRLLIHAQRQAKTE